jgi:hypothetical protein
MELKRNSRRPSMAETSKQPSNPPQGTFPSPSINGAANDSWDEWHQHGNKDAAGAVAGQHNKQPIPVGGTDVLLGM